MAVTFPTLNETESLPEDLPNFSGDESKEAKASPSAKRSRGKKHKAGRDAKVVEVPKPDMQIAPIPDGARTDYGGRPAWIGARVWYCLEDEFEPGTLRVLPADLMSRNYTDPSAWEIVVYHPDASNFPADAVQFSEVPKEGCWCWPVIPE